MELDFSLTPSEELKSLLSLTNDIHLMSVCWAIDRLRQGQSSHAGRFIRVPKEAIGATIGSKFYVPPWSLETLINEALSTRKFRYCASFPHRVATFREFPQFAALVNLLAKAEDQHDKIMLERIGVLNFMPKLAQRQFHWQRGYLSYMQLYRAAYLYGGQHTTKHLMYKYGFDYSKFILIGFVLFAHFLVKFDLSISDFDMTVFDMSGLSVSRQDLKHAMERMGISLAKARDLATSQRSGSQHVAYAKSILRQFPVIRYSEDQSIHFCPLPDLIMDRVTSGMFYEAASGSGEIRNEVSKNFESYIAKLFEAYLPDFQIQKSIKYKYKRNIIDSPDILGFQDGRISLVVECKARRMSYLARFGNDEGESVESVYDELVKGVCQIWRFSSHVRRGIVPNVRLSEAATGLILTLDNWLEMSSEMRKQVLQKAREVTQNGNDILPIDQIPIAFCCADDFELTLSQCSVEGLLSVLKASSSEHYLGWHLHSVLREIHGTTKEVKEFAFSAELHELLPWLKKLNDDQSAGFG